eukprot:CAMPEP_0174265298 /NCGR_PEP_ID=MMETSP0439-20130205/26000_1 /TAXON_ID=0 /ORGANISM="Stereomyxa ramosa, Strain Chinc5" /LENGTH=411 /DNA_ID=CAMNT_0015351697 /DNA_START=60 /DNA_END=1295 /DNA_ORIENTATION=-
MKEEKGKQNDRRRKAKGKEKAPATEVTAVRAHMWPQLPNYEIIDCGSDLLWEADDDSLQNSDIVSCPLACAQKISTYPKGPDGKLHGDPIADTFWIQFYENLSTVCVADGCNWGDRPKQAAQGAAIALRDYIAARVEKRALRDTHEIAHILLRGFNTADNSIMAGKNEFWEAGTTTLLGTIIFPMGRKLRNAVDENGEADEDCDTDWEGPSRFGIVCCSVGDCKLFIYSHQTKKAMDITLGNRTAVCDTKDPGGRLGPYKEGGLPDLRNLCLYFAHAEPGDLILVVSDGVHDNLDPQLLGMMPTDLGYDFDGWTEEYISPKEAEEIKTEYRNKLLSKIINKGDITPKSITKRIISHCRKTTQSSREFMEENPFLAQPVDYKQFPGKMDHTTCVCFVVDHWDSNTFKNGNKK